MARLEAGAALGFLAASCAGMAAPPPSVRVDTPTSVEAQPTTQPERQFLSAPLFPCPLSSWPLPERAADLAALAHAHSMTYDRLLETCQPHYAQIILPTASKSLSEQQIVVNQSAVADCAYHRYGSKPYWYPKLLSRVDVCEVVLGKPWRLPTETDLSAIPEAELLTERNRVKGDGFYFSLKFYVRTKNGLRQGDLSGGINVRPLISPAGGVVSDPHLDDHHLEGGVGVRCFRDRGAETAPRYTRPPGWSCAELKVIPRPAQAPPPVNPLSASVQAFARFGDKLVGGRRGLDVAETEQQLALIRPELEHALKVLKEPEPIAEAEGDASARSKDWQGARRDKALILYALQKIDARIDREREQPDPAKAKGGKPLWAPVSKQRLRELDRLQKAVVDLQNLEP